MAKANSTRASTTAKKIAKGIPPQTEQAASAHPGITVHTDSYNEAVTLLSEAEAILDVLGEVAPNADCLSRHTMQSCCLLAQRLVAEAWEKLLCTPRTIDHATQALQSKGARA